MANLYSVVGRIRRSWSKENGRLTMLPKRRIHRMIGGIQRRKMRKRKIRPREIKSSRKEMAR